MTAIAVAFIGVIGFIGIIVPQLDDIIFQYSLAIQMTLNILIGALTMLFADVVGKIVINPVQIPASIILSLVGIPILFYILSLNLIQHVSEVNKIIKIRIIIVIRGK